MKTGWILGAAFLSLAIVIVALLASTDTATVERLSARETLDGIDVPVIGTVGDFPDPAHRHVVNVTAAGRVVLDGETFATVWELRDGLTRRGELTQGEVIAGTNPPRRICGSVVLRVDGSAPWGVANWALGACAEATMWPVCFAARHDGDGRDGALTLGLPRPGERGAGGIRNLSAPAHERVVDVFLGESPGTAESLFSALRDAWALAHDHGNQVVMRIDPRTPTRTALAMLDAAIRAGATNIEANSIWLRWREPGEFDAESRRLRSDSESSSIRIDGRSIDEATRPEAFVAPPRGHGTVGATPFDVTNEDRSDRCPLPPSFLLPK